MFYTDELRRLTPLAYIFLACLVFWAVMFFAWPFWTGVVIAIAFGILGSYLVGDAFRARLRIRMKKRAAVDQKALQDQLDESRDDASRRS